MDKAVIDSAIALIEPFRSDVAELLRATPINLVDTLRPQSWAEYNNVTKQINLSTRHDANLEVEDLASSLLHEGYHALEDSAGALGTSRKIEDYVSAEQRAKRVEVDFIMTRNLNGKPEHDDFDVDTNKWIASAKEGTLNFVVATTYIPMWLQSRGLPANDLMTLTGISYLESKGIDFNK